MRASPAKTCKLPAFFGENQRGKEEITSKILRKPGNDRESRL
jgi:hypothetical protein